MSKEKLYRIAAFTETKGGGNPAGVWIGDSLPDSATMQKIAADVGYSETAFIAPQSGWDRTVRYFSPEAEVSFCGHATIASGVALGSTEGIGTYRLSTAVGLVPVEVTSKAGTIEAALTSVAPKQTQASEKLIKDVLSALHWESSELDPQIPPIKAYAGAWHLVLAVSTLARLNNLQYDFDLLKRIMLEEGLTTVQLIWRESKNTFHSRNPFPVGGVIEDPATGASAAALGGYLRDKKLVDVPCSLLIRQGEAMGRPSRVLVDIPETGGIVVSGRAVFMD